MIIILINFEYLFFNEELIICITLLLFFFLIFYNLKLVIKKYFFYKIEYIYFIFKILIDINIQITNLLLKCIKFYNNFINLIILIEFNSIKLIELNSIKINFILNLFLNKILANLLIYNKFVIKNNQIIFDLEDLYKIKYLNI
jgi:hypothetical protein